MCRLCQSMLMLPDVGPCEDCDGSKVYQGEPCAACGATGVHYDEPEPCPACLTYVVTKDVRVVALAGWDADEWPGWRAWNRAADSLMGGMDPIVPLHLSAGRDLAARVLDSRTNGYADAWAYMLRHALDRSSGYQYQAKLAIAGWLESTDAQVSALFARITAAAPADLRAGRALVLCLAATEPTAL